MTSRTAPARTGRKSTTRHSPRAASVDVDGDEADLHRLADWLESCRIKTGSGSALQTSMLRQRTRFEIRDPLYRLAGVDLTQIDAIGPYTALKLSAEIRTDMSRWPTPKHFTSWLTLAPKNKISGARLISSRTQPSANRAATILRMCAMIVGRTSTALGAYYRRIAYRVGKPKAITATARKLAVLVYSVLKGDFDYDDPGAQAYEEQHRARTVRNLRSRARTLGFGLVSLETGELLDGSVSYNRSASTGGAVSRTLGMAPVLVRPGIPWASRDSMALRRDCVDAAGTERQSRGGAVCAPTMARGVG
jgi:hypothetical protein